MALAHVFLPAGAVPLKHEPAADHGLLTLRSLNVTQDADMAHVTLHTWWVVPTSVSAVLRYVGNHPTPGSYYGLETGSLRIGKHTISRWEEAAWPLPGKGIRSRRMWVDATRLADGRTGVLAAVDVEWVVPRAASEAVPAGVHSVVITLVRPRHGGGVEPATEVTLSTPGLVRRAATLVDSLGAEQPIDLPCAEWPVTYQCPVDPDGPGSLTVTFLSASGRQTLAEARVGIPVGWGYTGVTGDPIQFWVHGRQGRALSGGAFVRKTLALAGLRERS